MISTKPCWIESSLDTVRWNGLRYDWYEESIDSLCLMLRPSTDLAQLTPSWEWYQRSTIDSYTSSIRILCDEKSKNWGKLILLKNRKLDNEWSFVSKFLQRWGRIGANTASSLLEWLLCTCTRKELAVVKSEFSNSLKSRPRRWTLLITQVSYGSSCLLIGRHDGCLSSTSSFTRDGSL